jgi:hypothetical protein
MFQLMAILRWMPAFVGVVWQQQWLLRCKPRPYCLAGRPAGQAGRALQGMFDIG